MSNDRNHRIPASKFLTRVRDADAGGDNPYRWREVSSDEVFSGRRLRLG